MVTTISFGVSLLGIVSLILFKRWELKREITWYKDKRAVADQFVVYVTNKLRTVPHIVRAFLSRAIHTIVFYVSNFVLHAVRFIERKLFKFVSMIKGRREVHHRKGSASLFLTSISDRNKDSEES